MKGRIGHCPCPSLKAANWPWCPHLPVVLCGGTDEVLDVLAQLHLGQPVEDADDGLCLQANLRVEYCSSMPEPGPPHTQ